jgi:GH25 family lysozyme M1 (1,4-beta-N-acetylmuramidase)
MAGSYGQDWASYQSSAPDTAGLAFAFVKVTEGLTYINPRWMPQRDHAKAAGLVWGGYHYPHMANDPVAEADRFLSLVDWQPGDVICLDWEGYDTANRSVPAAKQAAYKDAWLHYVKAKLPHNAVGTYMNVDYLTRVDGSGYHGDFLWIAVNAPAGQPGIRGQWMFHQYSSAGVDRDYCPLSAGELQTWALSFAKPAPNVTPGDRRRLDEEVR